MSNKILTEYPLWFTVFCIIIAFLYTILLYRKDKKMSEISKSLILLMSSLRFVLVFVISFLLLSPVIKNLNINIEKPIIIVAQDNSESLLLANKDQDLNVYKNHLTNLINKLSEEYLVETFTFGEKFEKDSLYKFDEKQTDFSKIFDELQNNYYNRNVGALIIASDGIYNEGINPIYSTSNISFPIYTVGLGDTTIFPDFSITKLRNNKIAFLGNKFPIQIYVNSKKLKNKISNLKIFNNGNQLFSKDFNINSNEQTDIIDAELEAKSVGVQRYVIQITPLDIENNKLNNTKEVAIDVMDSRQKILILANSPHPDVSAIRQSLSGNDNYEVEYFKAEDFTGSVSKYNLVILHQIPSLTNAATKLLTEIKNKNIPALFILGAQSSFNNLNTLDLGLKVTQLNNAYDESQATLNNSFALFEVDEEFSKLVESFPPLICPFGTYNKSANLKVLLNQKISTITTENPMISFSSEEGLSASKTCFISGEGIWRWRISDYAKNKNTDLFDELINKIVQYLALKINKEKFMVSVDKIINENKNINFEAEVYNDSYELVNDQDVNLEIKDSIGKVYNYIFDKSNKAYFLDAGTFPIGDYNYTATTVLENETLTKKGSFSIVAVNTESENIVANHSLLFQLAEQNNGKFFNQNQLDSIYNNIKTNKNIVPISYSNKKFTDILNLKWIFFLLLFLVSAEWFLRKYLGGY